MPIAIELSLFLSPVNQQNYKILFILKSWTHTDTSTSKITCFFLYLFILHLFFLLKIFVPIDVNVVPYLFYPTVNIKRLELL